MDAADVIPRLVVDVLTSNAKLSLSLALSFAFRSIPLRVTQLTTLKFMVIFHDYLFEVLCVSIVMSTVTVISNERIHRSVSRC